MCWHFTILISFFSELILYISVSLRFDHAANFDFMYTAWYAGTVSIYFVYNFYAFSVPVSFNSNVHDIKHNLTISYLVDSPNVNCTPIVL